VGERYGARQCRLQPFEWAGLPRESGPIYSSQITSPLNGLVNFLKSLNADVCELANSVGRKLRVHPGLCRMETQKSLRMMPDKAGVFENVKTRILSLCLEFLTLRRQSLS